MDLNWYCKECKRLNNGCLGSTDHIYSNCVYRKHWLDSGNKVKVIKYDDVGVIQKWDYITGKYFVKFDNGHVFPYEKSELEAIN